MKNDFKMILKASKKHFKSLLLKLRFFDKYTKGQQPHYRI